jgi:hypothetical protein
MGLAGRNETEEFPCINFKGERRRCPSIWCGRDIAERRLDAPLVLINMNLKAARLGDAVAAPVTQTGNTPVQTPTTCCWGRRRRRRFIIKRTQLAARRHVPDSLTISVGITRKHNTTSIKVRIELYSADKRGEIVANTIHNKVSQFMTNNHETSHHHRATALLTQQLHCNFTFYQRGGGTQREQI